MIKVEKLKVSEDQFLVRVTHSFRFRKSTEYVSALGHCWTRSCDVYKFCFLNKEEAERIYNYACIFYGVLDED